MTPELLPHSPQLSNNLKAIKRDPWSRFFILTSRLGSTSLCRFVYKAMQPIVSEIFFRLLNTKLYRCLRHGLLVVQYAKKNAIV